MKSFKQYMISEGLAQVAQEIVDFFDAEFNKKVGPHPWGNNNLGEPITWAPFDTKNNRGTMWTRMDGAKYKAPDYIHVPGHSWRHLASGDGAKQIKKHFNGSISMMKWAWELFKKMPGVQPAGEISGEHGSDGYHQVYKYKGMLFWMPSNQVIAYSTSKRLKNADIWRSK